MSENPNQSDAAASADPGVSQENIDGLPVPATEAPDAVGSTSELAPEDAADTVVSQDDIDALIGAAGDSSGSPEADVPGEERLDAVGQPFDDVTAAMQADIEEENAAAGIPPPPVSGPLGAQKPELPSFDSAVAGFDPKRVTMLNDVKLRVKIELGRTQMFVEDVLKLGEGSVVELDKLAGDPVDVYVNDRLVARGEVLVLNDNFCVRISDVISNDPHRVSA